MTRWDFHARHNGSGLVCTVEANNAPVAMAIGVVRAHEVFGCDSDLRAAYEGDTITCTLSPIDHDGQTFTGRYRLSFDEPTGTVVTCRSCERLIPAGHDSCVQCGGTAERVNA